MAVNGPTVVIGGGVIGLSVALRLRQAGRSVVLLERGCCGREASWAGAGIISPANPHRTDALYEMHCASIGEYPEFCAELADLSGVDPEYTVCGALDLLSTDQFVRMAHADVKATDAETTPQGDPVLSVLSASEAAAIEPAVTGKCLNVLHCRKTAQVRNPRLLRALFVACEKLGVVIREQVEVVGFEKRGGRVVGVRTADGVVEAANCVLCTGAWSSQLRDAALAELVPCTPIRGQILLLQADEPPFRHVVSKRQYYLVPRRDGRVIVGATHEKDSGFNKRNTAGGVHTLSTEALSMVPGLAELPMIAMWAGLRPGTDDDRPHLGPVPGYDGLIAATGHYRTGLTLAPVTARIVTDLITRGSTTFDLSRCAPGRS